MSADQEVFRLRRIRKLSPAQVASIKASSLRSEKLSSMYGVTSARISQLRGYPDRRRKLSPEQAQEIAESKVRTCQLAEIYGISPARVVQLRGRLK